MEHTPGPLSILAGTLMIGNTEIGTIIDFTPIGKSLEIGLANMDHLVACWNACEGMADPGTEVAKLRQGNADLLESLEQAAIAKALP
ncbi:hypothetical protein LCGC14_1579110 [marine sediment metagenome]|uniref:Uncharacterized protein n=1 Tax=marine sediment metagenome TaxID=412755 RepID=A0A0F9J3K2_9ZZZZ